MISGAAAAAVATPFPFADEKDSPVDGGREADLGKDGVGVLLTSAAGLSIDFPRKEPGVTIGVEIAVFLAFEAEDGLTTKEDVDEEGRGATEGLLIVLELEDGPGVTRLGSGLGVPMLLGVEIGVGMAIARPAGFDGVIGAFSLWLEASFVLFTEGVSVAVSCACFSFEGCDSDGIEIVVACPEREGPALLGRNRASVGLFCTLEDILIKKINKAILKMLCPSFHFIICIEAKVDGKRVKDRVLSKKIKKNQ